MTIDLAVWTAVDGYGWQPGSAYSASELSCYKSEIGPLVPSSLPLGGVFLKDGKAVFYRVQLAERMDSKGRGAIYCVLGTVPAERASSVDFAELLTSREMAEPCKPFPVKMESRETCSSAEATLGEVAFSERTYRGKAALSGLGSLCSAAHGGSFKAVITGTMDDPVLTVSYEPATKGGKALVEGRRWISLACAILAGLAAVALIAYFLLAMGEGN